MIKTPFRTSRGATAETLACTHLKQQGMALIERNYRTRQGEIDIIAKDGETLVFIEVRLRSHGDFGSAAQSINRRKQRRLISAAQHYLLSKGLTDTQPCRFDAVCMSTIDTDSPQVDSQHRDNTIDWIRDAFRPEA